MRDARPLATPKEVAAYLRKPDTTLRQWRYLGRGPKFHRLEGGEVRYRWADVEEWLDGQTSTAA